MVKYGKVWSELSPVYKNILKTLAANEMGDTETIYMKKAKFSPYRDRLIKNGIIYSKGWGFIDFVLPRFKQFIETAMEFE